MTPSLAGRRDLRRYSRHLLIPEVGLAGQESLAAARVLVVGAGGLGSPVLTYLAAAGVGRLGLIDDDVVDETNLQRQILYATADVGKPKAVVAADRLAALNPQIAIDAFEIRLTAANAREIVRLYDVVVDGTDTFGSRYLINDACVLEGKPDVYGSIFRFDGQVSVFGLPGGPCYRCLYPEPPPPELVPNCAEGGVLGVLAGIVGTWQASEALKLVLGIGTPLGGAAAAGRRARRADARGAHRARSGLPAVRRRADAARRVAGCRGRRRRSGRRRDRRRRVDAVLARDPQARLLDVREPHEAVLGAPPGAVSLPASELEARLHELDPAAH